LRGRGLTLGAYLTSSGGRDCSFLMEGKRGFGEKEAPWSRRVFDWKEKEVILSLSSIFSNLLHGAFVAQ